MSEFYLYNCVSFICVCIRMKLCKNTVTFFEHTTFGGRVNIMASVKVDLYVHVVHIIDLALTLRKSLCYLSIMSAVFWTTSRIHGPKS